MDIYDIREFYAQSLGVKSPWRVAAVSILGDKRRVEVRVECREGTVWTDATAPRRAGNVSEYPAGSSSLNSSFHFAVDELDVNAR